jgi:ABC-type multidrug transport system ATPase subunit
MVFGRRSRSDGTEPPLLEAQDPVRGQLSVGVDETVVLLGASGAGKTTILRSIVGVGATWAGVRLQGKPFSREQLARTVGWVPQGDGVFLSETVWQNVHAPKYVEPCPEHEAADALDWVGLADRADDPVSWLDLSARRRVALARAVARQRPLLIIDGEMDRSLWPMFPALCKQFDWLRGVVVATATADDLAWGADAVAPVGGGRILTQAPLAELVDSRDPEIKAVLAWTTP